MSDVRLNAHLSYQLVHVGDERTPILIIDDLVENPTVLIVSAGLTTDNGDKFQCSKSDYYPGVRKSSPKKYHDILKKDLFTLLQNSMFIQQNTQKKIHNLELVMSAYSMTTTKPEHLRPIQMLPHFDTSSDNQLAMVHYLCDENHGGTSIYRHKKTGFERITESRHREYRQLLKRQAISEKLHINPKYIEGDTSLFEQIFSVEAKINRAIIYPSNVLHSGNIRTSTGLSAAPELGRLTISSFLLLK